MTNKNMNRNELLKKIIIADQNHTNYNQKKPKPWDPQRWKKFKTKYLEWAWKEWAEETFNKNS